MSCVPQTLFRFEDTVGNISAAVWCNIKSMKVNVEFLSSEPLNNVITCMRYEMDKVLFFGYEDKIERMQKVTESFLKKYCGVRETEFVALPEGDFDGIRRAIRMTVTREAIRGHRMYFDITGGDSLILVAFGQLSTEFMASMHMFDVTENRLIEFNHGPIHLLSADAEQRTEQYNLDHFIEMQGGVINYRLQKNIKKDEDSEFGHDIDAIFDVAKKEWEVWNPFSEFLRTSMVPDENLRVVRKTEKVKAMLSFSGGRLRKIERFSEIIDRLAEKGVLKEVEHNDEIFRFRFKNREIKDCIWESGSILEMNVYGKEKAVSDDCRVGVHLDWDGVIQQKGFSDVINEVDVLSLKGNIVTFISCKSGKMDSKQTLHALYELDTVANRFGGKYARKVLVSAQRLSRNYLERAREMGIEVRWE